MANFDFKETFLNPIFKGNPISVLVLGICSSLAVTVQLKGAFVMGLSVIIVTGLKSKFESFNFYGTTKIKLTKI